jgi:hypothetical protein
MGCEGTTAWPPPLPHPIPMKSFKWGHPKEYVFAVPLRTTLDVVARLHTAVTVADANAVRCIQKNASWHVANCLEIDRHHYERLL